ncbi:MAG: hypothetical protein LPK02_02125 [Rhodobacterales bacterium]|nr:hypothetical protein [Rhodobacterales bacterium]
MSSLFEPSPILLAFIVLKTTLYLPAVLLLSLVRAVAAHGASRYLAIAAVLIAALGIAARFAPPLLGLTGGTVAQVAYGIANAGGGMVVALAASLPLALSAVVPGRRWIGIDALHGLLIAALFVLWWLAQ